MRCFKTVSVAAALVMCPTMSFGQATPDPVDAAASVPATRYDSAFTGYMTYQEQQPDAWREQNDAAGQAGGHAGHRKGTNAPSPSMPKAAPDHGGHK